MNRCIAKSVTSQKIYSRGVVHSVFDKVINIVDSHQLIHTIIGTEEYGLPDSIVVPTDDFLYLRSICDVGKNWHLIGKELVIDRTLYSIILPETKDDCKFSNQYSILTNSLQKRKLSIYISLADGKPQQLLQNTYWITHIINSLDCCKEEELVNTLIAHIGYGPGLTPSGDDFLLGVMAVLSLMNQYNYSEFLEKLSYAIKTFIEGRTTDISRKYLLCATQERFSRYVKDVVELLITDRSNYIENPIKNLMCIGESSGLDTMSGIVWAIMKFNKP